ncbi:MAG: glutamate--tRNA ligase [Thermodesulfobacteriota bacterium]
MEKVVTRFPPSPTGNLHVGGARTALFNWLLARSMGGRFVLRLEDTDVERSTQEMVDSIIEAMHWLGMEWDEGPYFQSRRFDIYNQYIEDLLQTGQAYYCRCSEEEVEAMRNEAWEKGYNPKYDGRCRNLGLESAPGRVVRFKSPQQGETMFRDVLKGVNSVDNTQLDDFVIRRGDGSPTYNLAVVVDDASMGITHILRGDDHLSNTPKQVLLYSALGFDLPVFGHVPMIMGPDKKKLSKRHGALSVLEYREAGYLPQALVNYLVRLGWSYGDREIFSRDELVELFSLDRLSKSASVFDPEKLDWVNSRHIKESPARDLASGLQGFLAEKGFPGVDLSYLQDIVPLLQPRATTLKEMAELAEFFLIPDDRLHYQQELLDKYFNPEVTGHLRTIRERFQELEDFSQEALESTVRQYLSEQGVKFKLLAQPIRIAVTGKTASPGIFETLSVLGKESVLNRLGLLLQALSVEEN